MEVRVNVKTEARSTRSVCSRRLFKVRRSCRMCVVLTLVCPMGSDLMAVDRAGNRSVAAWILRGHSSFNTAWPRMAAAARADVAPLQVLTASRVQSASDPVAGPPEPNGREFRGLPSTEVGVGSAACLRVPRAGQIEKRVRLHRTGGGRRPSALAQLPGMKHRIKICRQPAATKPSCVPPVRFCKSRVVRERRSP